jgi:M6 family metalloprotease-like protein
MRRTLFFAIATLLLCPTPSQTVHATGTLHGLVVLIDFPDSPATIPVSRAHDIINGVGCTEPTVTRSLRDYWYAQSRGAVALTHDVVGYYRAPQPASWYNTQTFAAYISLVRDALDWTIATNPGFDWNALSLASGRMNRNGTEEGTFLSISFLTTAWIPGTGGTHWLTGWTAPNGVQTQQIVGATFISPWDTDVNLFWLTHELGHSVWGWPDLYDTTGNSHGTGLYSLMSGNQSTGDIEPVGGPFLLAEGWARPVKIRNNKIILTPAGNAVARHDNPLDAREYFVIEARKKTTIGNSAFPVPVGLLIWHVDERVTTSNTLPQMTPDEHYLVSVEQADGRFDLEQHVNPGDATDIYVPGSVFGQWTTPNSNWWDGSASGLSIDDIRFERGRISFRALIN